MQVIMLMYRDWQTDHLSAFRGNIAAFNSKEQPKVNYYTVCKWYVNNREKTHRNASEKYSKRIPFVISAINDHNKSKLSLVLSVKHIWYHQFGDVSFLNAPSVATQFSAAILFICLVVIDLDQGISCTLYFLATQCISHT